MNLHRSPQVVHFLPRLPLGHRGEFPNISPQCHGCPRSLPTLQHLAPPTLWSLPLLTRAQIPSWGLTLMTSSHPDDLPKAHHIPSPPGAGDRGGHGACAVLRQALTRAGPALSSTPPHELPQAAACPPGFGQASLTSGVRLGRAEYGEGGAQDP